MGDDAEKAETEVESRFDPYYSFVTAAVSRGAKEVIIFQYRFTPGREGSKKLYFLSRERGVERSGTPCSKGGVRVRHQGPVGWVRADTLYGLRDWGFLSLRERAE